MTSNEIEQRLASAIESNNLYLGSAELVEELEKAGASIEVAEPILRFMEANPRAGFGSPGPLVHFLEHFYRHGYEEKLFQSLQRKPTAHTLWMLHALVNGAKDEGEKIHYLNVLRGALTHPDADEAARETAAEFLEYH